MTIDELKALVPPGPYTLQQGALKYPVLVGERDRVLTIIPPEPGKLGIILLREGGVPQFIGNITQEGIITPGHFTGRSMLDRLAGIERTDGTEWDEDPFALYE